MVNARDNLHSATLELVRSTPIKQRLIIAYRRHLTLIVADQLPSETRGSFTEVMRILGGVQPLRGEDAVAASVRKMSIQQADDCAALIVEMFGALCRADSATQRQPFVQLRSIDCAAPEFEAAALTATN